MPHVLVIAIGGALGAVSRYGISLLARRLFGEFFPIGTLSVNVIGSFIIGFCSIYFLNRMPTNSSVIVFVMVGFLGALTTFSSFSLETLQLFNSHHFAYAALNVILNLSLCLGGVGLGVYLARV